MSINDLSYRKIAERGPRYAVIGRIRQGESVVDYADTAEVAERIRQRMTDWGYYQVEVHPPVGAVNLAALAERRRTAKRGYEEATAILRAGVLRALEDGRAEAEVARVAGVDRMTVRQWAGKR